jgi:hypothetical protein
MKKIVSEIDNSSVWCSSEKPDIKYRKINSDGVYDERYLIEVTFPSGSGDITFGAAIMYEEYDDGEEYYPLTLTIISNEHFLTMEADDFIEFAKSKWQNDGNYDESSPIDEDPIATEVVVC